MGWLKRPVAPEPQCYELPCSPEFNPKLGGKGAQLNALLQTFGSKPKAGVAAVPPALVVPTTTFEIRVAEADIANALRAAATATDPDGVKRHLETARAAIEAKGLPEAVKREVGVFCAQHTRAGVACRSSAARGAARGIFRGGAEARARGKRRARAFAAERGRVS